MPIEENELDIVCTQIGDIFTLYGKDHIRGDNCVHLNRI